MSRAKIAIIDAKRKLAYTPVCARTNHVVHAVIISDLMRINAAICYRYFLIIVRPRRRRNVGALHSVLYHWSRANAHPLLHTYYSRIFILRTSCIVLHA